MNTQKIFNYHFSSKKDYQNYFVNQTNQKAYEVTNIKDFNQNIFLFGPKKSGKTYLVNLWKINNNAILYKNNFSFIINSNKNVVIDDVLGFSSEEELFHLINHCKLNNLKIYFASSINISTYEFKFKDLFSRLREFYYLEIKSPTLKMFQ